MMTNDLTKALKFDEIVPVVLVCSGVESLAVELF